MTFLWRWAFTGCLKVYFLFNATLSTHLERNFRTTRCQNHSCHPLSTHLHDKRKNPPTSILFFRDFSHDYCINFPFLLLLLFRLRLRLTQSHLPSPPPSSFSQHLQVRCTWSITFPRSLQRSKTMIFTVLCLPPSLSHTHADFPHLKVVKDVCSGREWEEEEEEEGRRDKAKQPGEIVTRRMKLKQKKMLFLIVIAHMSDRCGGKVLLSQSVGLFRKKNTSSIPLWKNGRQDSLVQPCEKKLFPCLCGPRILLFFSPKEKRLGE